MLEISTNCLLIFYIYI